MDIGGLQTAVDAAWENRTKITAATKGETRDAVDTFHAAGIVAGGTDNGAPGPRPIYHSAYYAAFVIDPEGCHVEVVINVPA